MELVSNYVENIEMILLVMRNQVLSFQVSLFSANQIHLLTFQLIQAQINFKMTEFLFLQADLILDLVRVSFVQLHVIFKMDVYFG